MTWAHPNFLYALLALPLIAVLFYLVHLGRRRRLARLAAAETRDILLPGRRLRVPLWRGLLWLLAAASAVVSIARPQWGFHYEDVQRYGLDVVFAVDASNSMLATDLRPSRFQKAQYGIADFTNRLNGDRVGLVVFAGASHIRCPLTDDYPFFRMSVNDLYPGIVQYGGTDIADALETAAGAFQDDREVDKVIILITDGEDHEGGIDEALESLKQDNIRLYAIGVGNPSGQLIEVEGDYLKDEDGNIVKSALQEEFLRDISLDTGGFYVRARPSEFGLDRIYDEGIADLQRADSEGDRMRVPHERFQWFIGLCLLALAAEVFITHRQPR